MIDNFRSAAAGLVIGAVVLVPGSGFTQTLDSQPQSGDWKTGDVIVGVGRFAVRPGEYVVLEPDGRAKTPPQVLADPFAGSTGITTGCAVGTPAFGEALFATTYFNRQVVRFAADGGHTASVAATVPSAPVEAIESIVFDDKGHYYVGGIAPGADRVKDAPAPYGYIFKFNTSHQLIATYTVPNENSGADWIDLGTDGRTLYYTSEGTAIHAYNPDLPEGSRYRRIQVKDQGSLFAGTLYSVRLLAPMPDDPATPIVENPSLEPSGFLVAASSGVLRLDRDGNVIARYAHPSVTGSYFALSLTPDGQSFWTATVQNDPDWREVSGPAPAPEGKILRYHIASGALTAGPLSVEADSVWGLCVKRGYSAGINACYELDPQGNAVLDGGQPVRTACRIPEVCGNARDDDGDGVADERDTDCASPLAPVVVPPADQVSTEGHAIAPVQLASRGGRGPLTFAASGLPAGLSISTSGAITGVPGWYAGAAVPYSVRVSVSDGTDVAYAYFKWKVNEQNGPPTLDVPAQVTLAAGAPLAIALGTRDPDLDTVRITLSNAPGGVAVSGLAQPPAYTVRLEGPPLPVGRYTIGLCAVDVPSVIVQHEPVCRTLTIAVTNDAPVVTAADQWSLLNVPVILQVSASDPDGHLPLAYSAAGLPAGLSIDAATGVISGAPAIAVVARPVELTVTDRLGAVSSATFKWTVAANRAPVCSGAKPSKGAIWPPNGKLVPITIRNVTDADGDAVSIVVTRIHQDEPVGMTGAGPDGLLDGSKAWVRAERTGDGFIRSDGRVYEIAFRATDGRESCTGSVLVGVPYSHEADGRRPAVDSTLRWDSLTGVRVR